MYNSKKKMKKDGNASARREPMQYGGMKKTARTKANMGRMMYKNGGMYKEDMPKAKPC